MRFSANTKHGLIQVYRSGKMVVTTKTSRRVYHTETAPDYLYEYYHRRLMVVSK